MRRSAVLAAVCFAVVSIGATDDKPITPTCGLQSEPITPGLVLNESPRPVHQVRLLAEVREKGGSRGTLILDPNVPEFDEFGHLVGGIQTPQVSGNRGALPAVELGCAIDFIKAGQDQWLLYRLTGPAISSPLFVATRGTIGQPGPARLLVLDGDKKTKVVISLHQYGLVVP
jgi:hypothetical protein